MCGGYSKMESYQYFSCIKTKHTVSGSTFDFYLELLHNVKESEHNMMNIIYNYLDSH